MAETDLDAFLAAAHIDESVFALRPDYRAILLAVDGLTSGPTTPASDELLIDAETAAAAIDRPIEDLPHVAAWREAYRAFGAKPQRTRPSMEALLRRAPSGLPRIDRLTDTYNAISVRHQIPIGGEDLTRYTGPPRLTRAVGGESFPTTSNGQATIEHSDPGEVIWRDDTGVTCRRWNWRQTTRTQLSTATTSALFIFDVLDPFTTGELHHVVDELLDHLATQSPSLHIARRLFAIRDG